MPSSLDTEEKEMKGRIAFWGTCTILAGVLVACGGLSTPVPNPGGPWYADPAGNDANDCLSPATACATIQAAIDKADPGGIVMVAPPARIRRTSSGTRPSYCRARARMTPSSTPWGTAGRSPSRTVSWRSMS